MTDRTIKNASPILCAIALYSTSLAASKVFAAPPADRFSVGIAAGSERIGSDHVAARTGLSFGVGTRLSSWLIVGGDAGLDLTIFNGVYDDYRTPNHLTLLHVGGTLNAIVPNWEFRPYGGIGVHVQRTLKESSPQTLGVFQTQFGIETSISTHWRFGLEAALGWRTHRTNWDVSGGTHVREAYGIWFAADF